MAGLVRSKPTTCLSPAAKQAKSRNFETAADLKRRDKGRKTKPKQCSQEVSDGMLFLVARGRPNKTWLPSAVGDFELALPDPQLACLASPAYGLAPRNRAILAGHTPAYLVYGTWLWLAGGWGGLQCPKVSLCRSNLHVRRVQLPPSPPRCDAPRTPFANRRNIPLGLLAGEAPPRGE